MFHSVSLLSQAPLARGSRALPSVLFVVVFYKSLNIVVHTFLSSFCTIIFSSSINKCADNA